MTFVPMSIFLFSLFILLHGVSVSFTKDANFLVGSLFDFIIFFVMIFLSEAENSVFVKIFGRIVHIGNGNDEVNLFWCFLYLLLPYFYFIFLFIISFNIR
jgi:hypothetical protein